jgi:hypothetical protein
MFQNGSRFRLLPSSKCVQAPGTAAAAVVHWQLLLLFMLLLLLLLLHAVHAGNHMAATC